jgi:hypothetical protein
MGPIKPTMRSRAALFLGAAAFLSAADAPAGAAPATIGQVAAHRDDHRDRDHDDTAATAPGTSLLASLLPTHTPDRRDHEPTRASDTTVDASHATTAGCEAMGVSDGAAGALLLLAGALLSAVLRHRRQAGRED